MPTTLAYSPLTPQDSAEFLRPCPCRYARYAETRPLQPLKGHQKPHATSVSYQASVPAGLGGHGMLTSHRALAPAADRQNRSFKALSGKGSVPASPPPFRHTPGQSLPRHTAPVWRNLGRHPHRDGTFTFSAKEKDSETGLSYFGSRYYSSDLSIWLSVDPMAAKYASLSPYTYCTNNPVKLVDPNGEEVWIPGVDEKGNVTYTAEAGDNLGTFASQFDCRDVNGRYLDADGQYISERIFKNAKLSTTEDIKEGTVIKGEHVKEATNGSDVLKGNWWKMNDSQKASQIMFALMYGANKKHTLPNGLFGIDLNDFINGFYSKDGGSKYYNVTIPLKGGDKIVVDMWLAPFTAFEGEKGSLWVETSPEWGDYNDARSADPARFRTAKNANADRPMKVITFSVPANRRNDFNNSLKR